MEQRSSHTDFFSYFFGPFDSEERDTRHPRGEVTRAALVFHHGASRVRLAGGSVPDELFHARTRGLNPDIDVQGGEVNVRYRSPPAAWLFGLLPSSGFPNEVELNPEVAWELRFHGGLTQLDADLRALKLRGIKVAGGATHLRLALPRPQGRVPVQLYGGATHLALTLPKDAPCRVRVAGGATHLEVGENRFGAICGPAQWVSPGFADAPDAYDLEVMGGASHVCVRFEEAPASAER